LQTGLKERAQGAAASKLSLWQILSYGSVMLPLSMGWVTLMMFIPTYYAVDLGLGLGLVGVLFAAGRLFDFITDPAIGLLTDKTQSPIGARKPWMIFGLPLFCLGAWLLLNPPEGATAAYLLLVSCLYFLSFTISEIPLAAMGLEISSDKNERTALAASKTLFLILGGIMGAAAPLIWTSSTALALFNVTLMICVSALIVVPIFLWIMPHDAQPQIQNKYDVKDAFAVLKANREIQKIIGTFFLLITAKAFGGALSLLYISYILQMPSLVGLFWIATGLGMLCGLPFWLIVARKIGKVKAWRAATIIGIIFYTALLFLGAGNKVPMFIISLIIGVSGVADSIFSVSLLADQIGAEQEKGRPTSAGLVTAIKNALSKLSAAIPMATAFPLLGMIGLTKGTSNIAVAAENVGMTEQFVLIGLYAGVQVALKIAAFFAIGRLNESESRT